MEPNHKKSTHLLFTWGYLLVLGGALYFAKAMPGVHKTTYLVLLLAVTGLVLGILFRVLLSRGSVLFFLFQILQGGLAFVFAKFLFGQPLQESLAYPAGAVAACFAFWLLNSGTGSNFGILILGAFLAGGMAVDLRLAGIPGALLFALALLNSFYPGDRALSERVPAQRLWIRAIFLTALLAAGRAAIQYYLVQSNYANLGVVITHPYTYVALVAGLVLPFLAVTCTREKILAPAFWIPLMGVLIPLALGVFFHVRPMAGFLLGLVTAVFLAGLLYDELVALGLLQTLAMLGVVFALPLFKHTSDWSRIIRLEILAGLLVLAVLFYLGVQRSKASRVQS